MNSKQVFHNAKWIIICKLVQSLLQLVVGMLCARYLGPSDYGLINYAASITAFALPLMKLGFDATMVYELVAEPEKEREIMGTSLLLNIVSSILCIGGVAAFVSVVNAGEPIVLLVCLLHSSSVFFAAVEMVQYWFQYKLMSKYPSVVMLLAYVVVSAYRIVLLITGKSVYWFALTNSIDFGLIGAALVFLYLKKGSGFSFSWARAKQMLNKSKHYILAALMVTVIQNTDHVMLTNLIDESENGLYSAAITCVSTVQFVYIAIIDSFRPLILSAKNENTAEYQNNISRLYSIISYMSIAQAVLFCLFAKPIIWLLYGEAYFGAIPVLRILVWYFLFSAMGTVRNIWILAEQKQRYLWIINLSGALFNVALNGVMIPLWGASGAAAASLLTQCFANFILGFILKPIRENNRLMLRGLHPRFFADGLKRTVQLVLKRGK